MDYLLKYQNVSPECIPPIDFHLHTSWTDGIHSVKEMYDCAVDNGLEGVLFSEHIRRTSIEWFYLFATEVRLLQENGCKAFLGMETKIIDFEGNLDCTREMITKCDIVIASVHRFPEEKDNKSRIEMAVNKEEMIDMEFRLASLIIENENVDILGHPFGMCLKRFNITPDEERVRLLIEKAAQRKVAFEINAHYHTDPWRLIRWCKEAGAAFSLGSDAHRCTDVGRIVRVLKGQNYPCNV